MIVIIPSRARRDVRTDRLKLLSNTFFLDNDRWRRSGKDLLWENKHFYTLRDQDRQWGVLPHCASNDLLYYLGILVRRRLQMPAPARRIPVEAHMSAGIPVVGLVAPLTTVEGAMTAKFGSFWN